MPQSLLPRAADALTWHQDVVREVLPNGLTLLIRRDVSAPVVAIVTHVKAGYFDESDADVGIAHVLEHMYFKGTPTRGVGAIARDTKSNGGYLNAHTIYDHTCYYTVLPSAAFLQGLEIQFDAYCNSSIDANELEREIEVIVQEVRRKRDTAGAVAIESLYALLHDHHRIRRWRMGEENALRTFTREQLLKFYRHWYRPDNTILSIVGNVDPDVVRTEVLSRYGALLSGTVQHVNGPQEKHPSGFRAREWAGDIAQMQLVLGWRTPSLNHIDTPALDMAATALGSGRASRFYRAVRERRLATSVSAYDYTAGSLGVFTVHAETPPKHARDALLNLWREVHAARVHGLRRSELVRAQRINEARWLRRLETMDGQATYFASWEADGGLDCATQYYDRLFSATVDDVRGALERNLDPAQVACIAYRPNSAEPIADNAQELREVLREVEGTGSSVLPPPETATPAHAFAAIPRPVRTKVVSEGVDHGVQRFRTTNGVPVLVMRRVGAPIVNVGVFVRGGASLEPEFHDGLARLCAQSVLKGTSHRSGARIAESAEELGGSIAVSAGLESIGWSLSVPVRHLPMAIELLADVTQNPVFADEGVETERQLAQAEVERLRDDMYRWPLRLATMAAFGQHPYARAITGTEASLAQLGASHVKQYHQAHVSRGPAVIGIVGDVEGVEVAPLIAEHFGRLEWNDDIAPSRPVWPAATVTLDDTRQKQQTALAMLFGGPGRDAEARHAARVLGVVASGLGGRFFEQLRDRQSLAYTVTAFPVERRRSGTFAAYIATDPNREEEARAGLLAEFAKLCDAPPTDEELRRAKRYLIGTHAIALQSGASVLADMIDAFLFGHGLAELDEFVPSVERVEASHLLDLAQTYFDPARRAEGVVRGER